MTDIKSLEKIYLFDTTLRDGQQSAGVDFSIADKQRITTALDHLGLDYIEGGYPGANSIDTEFFSMSHSLKHARMTAFGMTKRAGRSADNDPGLAQILNAKSDVVCLVAKSWDYHVDVALNIPREENLHCIRESVEAIIKREKEAIIDCEHFFDGYKANPDYALKCAITAFEAGARWVVLCDTNGGTLPFEVYEIIQKVTEHIAGYHLGIHAHNDTEHAVANSLIAVEAGVRQIQGTLNGLGERCGNANMISLIPTLMLKPYYAERFVTSIPANNVAKLTKISRLLDDILNQTPHRHQPYVGASAFAHKGGIHVSAVRKDPKTYEHIDPQLVGNERQIQISNQAGRSNIIAKLEQIGINDVRDEDISKILDKVKEQAECGYNYDDAEASFELLARKVLGQFIPPFDNIGYRLQQQEDDVVEAVLQLQWYAGEKYEERGKGHGPVNALDVVLRKIFEKIGYNVQQISLVDYKVRILDTGTNAVTRVLIESSDDKGHIWRTVGISKDIMTASLKALSEAYFYKKIL